MVADMASVSSLSLSSLRCWTPRSVCRGIALAGRRREVLWRGIGRGRPFPVAVEAGKKMDVDTVQLTELEDNIFGVLVATLQRFELDTELRVAGGWVRDKVRLPFPSILCLLRSSHGC
jgi:hypothetical protein